MSMVHMAVENVTEEGEAWDTYSVIDNMTPYRVEVADDGNEFNVYDTEGNKIKNDGLAQLLIQQVEEFIKGEK